MKKHWITYLAVVALPVGLHAGDSNIIGDITATGSIRANGTYLFANTYVRANDYIITPGYIQANSYFTTPGHLVAQNYVYSPLGAFLSVRTGNSTVSGTHAVSMGNAANAVAFSSVAVGRFNNTLASDGGNATTTSWVDKDQLFVVGNGNGVSGDPNQLRNAFVIYKDGTITMSKAQGDILMGQFGN